MPTLPKVAAEMNVAINMKQIMGVMKGIAMSSFIDVKKKREERFEKFMHSFNPFFQLADLTGAASPFVQEETSTVCVIAVTSNESFMAGMNNRVIRVGIDRTEGHPTHFIVTGPRMVGRLKSEKVDYTVFPGFREKNLHEIAGQIKDFVIRKVREGEFGKVIAVYADPVSLGTQEVRPISLLPAHDVYPQDLNADLDASEETYKESTIDSIMEFLSEIWLKHKLAQIFLDNKMSEYAAQAMTLDGSLQNLEELNKKLKLLFVKTRREIIDSALRETVAAMMVNAQGS